MSQDSRLRHRKLATILWVDDEVVEGDAVVGWLTKRGFQIDCANAGATALAKISTRSYDAVLLSLCLPDMPGLQLLRALRDQLWGTPVAVMTRPTGVETAVLAIKMGAVDYRHKPLSVDEMAAVLLTLTDPRERAEFRIESDLSRANVVAAQPESDTAQHTHATLVTKLQAIVQLGHDGPSAACDPASTACGLSRITLLGPLVDALGSGCMSARGFLACAQRIKQLLCAGHGVTAAQLIEQARGLIEDLARVDREAHHPLVRSMIAKMEAFIQNHVRPDEQALACELGLSRSYIGRLLRAQTDRDFRQWRRTLALKAAMPRMIHSETQVAQVAYGVGFDHPSQFDREFKQVFGVTPKTFRRVVRTAHSRNGATQGC